MSQPTRPPIGARQVALVAAAVVAFVLGLQVASAFVPPLAGALEVWPLLIWALVAVTVIVLFYALRPRSR